MNTPFDFEKYNPPIINEKKLMEIKKSRELKRQIILLRLASVFVGLCMVLFAFYIARDSLIIAIISVCFFCISLIGNGIVSVLFYRRERNSDGYY